jgi:FAD/FMN-containing dehydrogenase
VDNIWVDGEPEVIAQKLYPLFTELPEQLGFTIWYSMGPLRELPDMAFSMQSPGYVATYLVSNDESHDAENREWLDRAMANAQSVTKGTYLGDSDFGNRQLEFLSAENYARLQKVIADRDPDGRFVRYLSKDPANLNRNHWQL